MTKLWAGIPLARNPTNSQDFNDGMSVKPLEKLLKLSDLDRSIKAMEKQLLNFSNAFQRLLMKLDCKNMNEHSGR